MVLIPTVAEIGSYCPCILEQPVQQVNLETVQVHGVNVSKYCRTTPRDALGMLYRQQRSVDMVSITRRSSIVGKGCAIRVADVVSNMAIDRR